MPYRSIIENRLLYRVEILLKIEYWLLGIQYRVEISFNIEYYIYYCVKILSNICHYNRARIVSKCYRLIESIIESKILSSNSIEYRTFDDSVPYRIEPNWTESPFLSVIVTSSCEYIIPCLLSTVIGPRFDSHHSHRKHYNSILHSSTVSIV